MVQAKHLNIKITGLVQGVSFRWWAREMAKELGVTGFSKNLNDGSLYIEAEGTPEALEKFVHACHEGPTHAKVSDVETEDGEVRGYEKFVIRYE